jgi:S1-C subfamily serine protease
VDPDYGLDDDGPFSAWLPPEDRLWRHPSEIPPASEGPGSSGGGRLGSFAARLGLDGRDNPRVWTVAVIAGLIGALAASGIGMASGVFDHTRVVDPVLQPRTTVTVAVTTPQLNSAWTAVGNRVAPSVVGVSVNGPAGVENGSGVLLMLGLHGWAYVVTDRSLLSLAGEPAIGCCVQITYANGLHASGEVVGEDALSGLAVLEVANTPSPTATLGSVSSLRESQAVIAVPARTSTPLGSLPGTVIGESVKVDLSEGTDMDNLLAVSPALPNGTSGSALVDQSGQVVGITLTLDPMVGNGQGPTFAVPIDEALMVTKQVLAHQQVVHPWLGVANANDVPPADSTALGIKGGVTAGSIASGSPASKAGIKPSDIIYQFNSHDVASAGALTALLDQCQPNLETTISFIHDYKRITRTIVVTNEPNDS